MFQSIQWYTFVCCFFSIKEEKSWIHGSQKPPVLSEDHACSMWYPLWWFSRHLGESRGSQAAWPIHWCNPIRKDPGPNPRFLEIWVPRLWFDVTEIFHTRHTYLIQCWYTKTADVFLLPSDDEGRPGSTWECFWKKWLTCFRWWPPLPCRQEDSIEGIYETLKQCATWM